MPWADKHSRTHMALWAAIATAWVALGANSDNVPFSDATFWLIACTLVAGTALGVAHRATKDSVAYYFAAAGIVAAIRAGAYAVDDAAGPGFVWLIVTLTNVVLLVRWNDAR